LTDFGIVNLVIIIYIGHSFLPIDYVIFILTQRLVPVVLATVHRSEPKGQLNAVPRWGVTGSVISFWGCSNYNTENLVADHSGYRVLLRLSRFLHVNDIVCRFRTRACAFEFPPLLKANCFVLIQLFVPFD
jgi:hypothetical protein